MSASFFSKFTIHSCAVSFFLSFIYFPRLQYHSGSGFAPLLPHGTSTQVDTDSGVSPAPGAVLESFMQPWDSRQPSAKLHPFWSAFMHWNCTFQELYVSNSLNCVVEDSLEFMSVFSAHIVVLAWTLDFSSINWDGTYWFVLFIPTCERNQNYTLQVLNFFLLLIT